MQLEVLTPITMLYSAEKVALVKLPGSKGSFEILKDHAPIISSLENGIVKIVQENKTEIFIEITGGVVECKGNKVVVLADSGKMVE